MNGAEGLALHLLHSGQMRYCFLMASRPRRIQKECLTSVRKNAQALDATVSDQLRRNSVVRIQNRMYCCRGELLCPAQPATNFDES